MSYRRKDYDASQLEEDSASAVTVVEGRKMHTTVSFSDWANKSQDYSGAKRKSLHLERMGSGVSCGDSSGSAQYAIRFNNNGLGKTANGLHWVEQMQIHPSQDEAFLHYPFLTCEETIKYRHDVEEVQGKRITTQGFLGREEDNKEKISPTSPEGEDKCGRVHMFDKAVTPSDVGKLNRLVIPKHHAEKHFPLDTSEKDKGLLLTFQDSAGKEWRFRYSYWSSSQSYVLTKGWSRFVREMKLHAGDVVSFHRGADTQKLHQFYISWKRRTSKAPPLFSPFQSTDFQSQGRTGKAQNPSAHHPVPPPLQWMSFGSAMPTAAPFWAEQLNIRPPTEAVQAVSRNWGREAPQCMKIKPVEQPAVQGSNPGDTHKRVRLFGVNL